MTKDMGGGVEIAPMHECTRRDALLPALVDRRRRLCAEPAKPVGYETLGGRQHVTNVGWKGIEERGGDIRKERKRGCRGRIVEKGEELMRVRDSGKWRSVDYLKREG